VTGIWCRTVLLLRGADDAVEEDDEAYEEPTKKKPRKTRKGKAAAK
jgi:hypothetical protein